MLAFKASADRSARVLIFLTGVLVILTVVVVVLTLIVIAHEMRLF